MLIINPGHTCARQILYLLCFLPGCENALDIVKLQVVIFQQGLLPFYRMASLEMAPEQGISKLDDTVLQELSMLLGRDMTSFAEKIVGEEEKKRAQMQKGYNAQMRSEVQRLKSFETNESLNSWTPQEMAAVGFYHIMVEKSALQCFCCSLILFHASLRRSPLEEHKKFYPNCAFLLGRDVGNISKYDVRVKRLEQLSQEQRAVCQEEKARLASFQNWPFYVQMISPQELSAAGFVFTGNLKSF